MKPYGKHFSRTKGFILLHRFYFEKTDHITWSKVYTTKTWVMILVVIDYFIGENMNSFSGSSNLLLKLGCSREVIIVIC